MYSLVLDVCALADSGEYRAVLRNKFGEAQTKCRVNVHANPALSAQRPICIEQLKDVNVMEGQDVCFKCKITGIPPPDVAWFKDGEPLKEDERIRVSKQKVTNCFVGF